MEVHGEQPPARPFKCDICSKPFRTKKEVVQHIKTHSEEGPFPCEICEKPFRLEEELKNHKTRMHTKRDRQKCEICGKNVVDLKQHLKRHGDVKAFHCENCDRRFITKKELHQHRQRVHLSSTSIKFDCNICSKKFKSLIHLKAHQSSVHGPVGKFHKCDLCDKSYKSVGILKAHISSHTGERPYKCSECDKSFSTNGQLNQHKKVHSDERPFSCEICSRRFTDKYILRNHLQTHIPMMERPNWMTTCPLCEKVVAKNIIKKHLMSHDGIRPFKCDVCGKDFGSRGHWKRHLQVHSNHRPFSCEMCNKNYKYSKDLKVHMVQAHGSEKLFQCEVCSKSLASNDSLRVHSRIHNREKTSKILYTCVFCGRTTSGKETFDAHLRTHVGELFFGCDICDKKYSRKVSLGIPSLQEGKCGICGKAFRTYDVLRIHLKTHSDKVYACLFCEVRAPILGQLLEHIRKHIGELPFICRICGKEHLYRGSLKSHESSHAKKKLAE